MNPLITESRHISRVLPEADLQVLDQVLAVLQELGGVIATPMVLDDLMSRLGYFWSEKQRGYLTTSHNRALHTGVNAREIAKFFQEAQSRPSVELLSLMSETQLFYVVRLFNYGVRVGAEIDRVEFLDQVAARLGWIWDEQNEMYVEVAKG